MLVFVLVTGIAPAAAWLELVPLVAWLLVLTAAVSMLLAVLYVPFRDMAPIWEVATQLLFWGTPIIYVIETAPGERARAADDEPAGGDHRAGAPCRDRPVRAQRGRRRSAAPRCC